MSPNLAAPNAFVKVVKVINHSGLWNGWAHLILSEYDSMASSTALECLFLDLYDLFWLLRLLQPEQNFLNHLVTLQWLTASSPFAQQMFLVASLVLWPSLNLLSISSQTRLLYTHLYIFKITHTVKKCTSQHTNYHIQQVLLPSCDICASNKRIPKYCKTFDSI